MTYLREIQRPEASDLIPVADQPSPMLQWVEIAAMVIDDRYQRPINAGGWRTVRAIAEKFNWACFTPVLLAPIEGGQFAVIDGQHRVHAAAMCGIKSVPSMVVPIAATEQARAFLQVNTARTAMSQFNKFKAGLAAGEMWAIEADKAVRDAGCTLMRFTPSAKSREPGQILCVALVREMVSKGHAKAVTTTLTAIRAIDGGGASSILLYSDWLLNPLMKAVASFGRLDAETLTDCLRRKKPFHIMDAAERLAKADGKSVGLVARQMFEATIGNHIAQKDAA